MDFLDFLKKLPFIPIFLKSPYFENLLEQWIFRFVTSHIYLWKFHSFLKNGGFDRFLSNFSNWPQTDRQTDINYSPPPKPTIHHFFPALEWVNSQEFQFLAHFVEYRKSISDWKFSDLEKNRPRTFFRGIRT